MKILAIRGKNLASLEGEFAIDLRAQPLGQTGLYAIGGPTGAGKSTILDALCLALFDRTPRLHHDSGVLLGAPEDEGRLRSNDVRTLLRRGAAHGYAEVEFVGQGGQHFRSRWSVRRARDRALARVQASAVELVDEATGRVLGTTKSETLALIVEKLGLSFEQFCRSALLAQGEFAALLRSSVKDRAELLERMTGTELYGRLSIASFERAKRAHSMVADLLERVQSEVPLGEETRQSLERELEQRNQALLSLRLEELRLAKTAEYQLTLAALQREVEAALEKVENTEREIASSAAERAELAQIKRFEVLRPFLQALERTRSEETQSLARREQAVVEHGEQRQRWQNLVAQTEQALPALVSAQEKLRVALPEFERCRLLDQEIALGQAEKERSASECATAERGVADLHRSLGRSVGAVADAERSEHAANAALALLPSEAELVLAVARARLQPEEPCPLCGATEHPKAMPIHDEQIRDAGARFEERRRLEAERDSNREAFGIALSDKRALQQLLDDRLRSESVAKCALTERSARLTELELQRQNLLGGRGAKKVEEELQLAVKRLAERHRDAARLEADERLALAVCETSMNEASKLVAERALGRQRAEAEFVAATAKMEETETEIVECLRRGNPQRARALEAAEQKLVSEQQRWRAIVDERKRRLELERSQAPPTSVGEDEIENALRACRQQLQVLEKEVLELRLVIERDEGRRRRRAELVPELARRQAEARRWQTLSDLIGSADGKKFRVFAQSLTLEFLIEQSNRELARFAPRYRLMRALSSDLDLQVIDGDLGDEVRGVSSLSGGETFLVSLALALSLSALSTTTKVESLFIDEGFATLDAVTLDTVLAALDALQSSGRQIGVISHMPGLAERLGVEVRVVPLGAGRSRVEVTTA